MFVHYVVLAFRKRAAAGHLVSFHWLWLLGHVGDWGVEKRVGKPPGVYGLFVPLPARL